MDLCECDFESQKRIYLITVDRFSDYFDVDELRTPNTAAVIQACKKNFARFGVPQEVSSDGGPQFMSQEFIRFATLWDFKHSVSAPFHQQANGKAESAVKIAKMLMKKAHESKQDFWKLLLQWRNTPNKVGCSPVQRLLSRRTRFDVPMSEAKYSPKLQEGIKEKIVKCRQQAKLYYDRKTRRLPDLEFGQPIFVKLKPSDKEWQRGTVVDPITDRSTIISVGEREYRRDNTCIKPALPSYVSSKPKEPSSGPLEHPKTFEQSTPVAEQPMADIGRPKRIIRLPKRFEDFEVS